MIDRIIHHINAGEVEHIGIRVVHGQAPVKVGDLLPASYRWEDGESTGEELRGTSAILVGNGCLGANEAEIRRALRIFESYRGLHGQIVLISGESQGAGEDVGEIIIDKARVIEVLS